jgi:hypothetical protein
VVVHLVLPAERFCSTSDAIGKGQQAGRLVLVEASLSRMFERLGVLSRAELAIRADREGWLEPL